MSSLSHTARKLICNVLLLAAMCIQPILQRVLLKPPLKTEKNDADEENPVIIILVIDIGSSSIRCSPYSISKRNSKDIRPISDSIKKSPFNLHDMSGKSSSNRIRLSSQLIGIVERTMCECIISLGSSNRNLKISAIGISSFAMNITGVDSDGNPCTPLFTYATTVRYDDNDMFKDTDESSHENSDKSTDSNAVVREKNSQKVSAIRSHLSTTGTMLNHQSYAIAQLQSYISDYPDEADKVSQWVTLSSMLIARWSIPISSLINNDKSKINHNDSIRESEKSSIINSPTIKNDKRTINDYYTMKSISNPSSPAQPSNTKISAISSAPATTPSHVPSEPLNNSNDNNNNNNNNIKNNSKSTLFPPVSYCEASWIGLLNFTLMKWDPKSVNLALINPETLPELTDFKGLSERVMKKDRLSQYPELEGCVFYPGIGDGAAATIGSNCEGKKRVSVTIGTSAAVRVIIQNSGTNSDAAGCDSPDSPIIPPKGLFCYRLDKDRLLLGGALTDGGSLLDWFHGLIGTTRYTSALKEVDKIYTESSQSRSKGLKELNKEQSEELGQCVTVLPFWSGERSIGWHYGARGMMTGLSHNSSSTSILMGIMEGLAYRISVIILLMMDSGLIDSRLEACLIVSGTALECNESLKQMIANFSGYNVVCLKADGRGEATSYGIAKMIGEKMVGEKKIVDTIDTDKSEVSPSTLLVSKVGGSSGSIATHIPTSIPTPIIPVPMLRAASAPIIAESSSNSNNINNINNSNNNNNRRHSHREKSPLTHPTHHNPHTHTTPHNQSLWGFLPHEVLTITKPHTAMSDMVYIKKRIQENSALYTQTFPN